MVRVTVKRGKAALSREDAEIKALETKLGISASKPSGLNKLKKCVFALVGCLVLTQRLTG